MTVRTLNRSMLSSSRCRPCCTLNGLSSTLVFAPKNALLVLHRVKKLVATHWTRSSFRRDTRQTHHTAPLSAQAHESSAAQKRSFVVVLCRHHHILHGLGDNCTAACSLHGSPLPLSFPLPFSLGVAPSCISASCESMYYCVRAIYRISSRVLIHLSNRAVLRVRCSLTREPCKMTTSILKSSSAAFHDWTS